MFDQAGGRKRALAAIVDFVDLRWLNVGQEHKEINAHNAQQWAQAQAQDLRWLNVGQEHEEINAQELAPFWIFWHTLSTSR